MKLQHRNKKRRIERQQEAVERQAAYDALTPQQKFDRIVARDFLGHCGASKRETTALVSEFGGAIKT